MTKSAVPRQALFSQRKCISTRHDAFFALHFLHEGREKFFSSAVKFHLGPIPRGEFIRFIQAKFAAVAPISSI